MVYATISGVDYVSIGALTHSAPVLDLSLILETAPVNLLTLESVPALQAEVRALAAERGAVILAHNYQLPEVQDVADFVGDSLGLSQQAAKTDAEVIAFCGVHFMAETASVLSPEKTVLLPDMDAGCSLADSITADQLRAWKAKHPDALVVMYVNTTAEVKAETDYCVTSSNAVQVVEHIYREHGADTEILFGPDMFLGAYVEKQTGPQDARVGRRVPRPRRHPPERHRRHARLAPGRGLPDPPRVRLLDLGDGVRRGRRRGRRRRPHALDRRDDGLGRAPRRRARRRSWPPRPGCCTRCRWRGPTSTSWPPTRRPSCRYMKMITLPKLRDTLRDMSPAW